MFVLIATLIAGNILHQFGFFGGIDIENILSSPFGAYIFTSMVFVSFLIGQFLFMRFAKKFAEDKIVSSLPHYFDFVFKAVRIVQCVSAVIFTVMLFQMLIASQYSIVLLVVAISINFAFMSLISGMVSYRFFSWLKLNRSITVSIFGISFALFALFGILVSVLFSYVLLTETTPSDVAQSQHLKKDSAFLLYQYTGIPFRLGFLIFWFGTALLLRNYSAILGKYRFWALMSLPFVFFLIAQVFLFGIIKQTVIFPSLLAYSSITIGTIIFAFVLLRMAKSMRGIHNNAVGNYLTLSAYGIVIFFAAIAHAVIHAPYPPFSAVCWSFAGFGAMLFTFGMFFSAISISHDLRLRWSIKQMATSQSRLLDSIGTAQMEEELNKKILFI
jgi:MFS family permease